MDDVKNSMSHTRTKLVSLDSDDESTNKTKLVKKGGQSFRQILLSDTMKNKLKELKAKMTAIQLLNPQQAKIVKNAAKTAFEESDEESLQTSEEDDSDNDRVVETKENPYIVRDEETKSVYLTSPTFGDKIQIYNPQVRFGTSVNAMKDLKHVEGQIKELKVLPDFGYAQDNYLLETAE